MGSISVADPGESTQVPSFDEFQKQTSLMTSCTLLWKELSDHFTSLEQTLMKKSDAIKHKIETLDTETKASLVSLEQRETTIDNSVAIALQKIEDAVKAATAAVAGTSNSDDAVPEVDDSEGLLLKLKSYCLKMDSLGFWGFVSSKKKEMELMKSEIPLALSECVDPARFVFEAISEIFPVDKRKVSLNDMSWACVLILESLIPVMVDPILGKTRVLVTPSVKKSAIEIAEKWKKNLEDVNNNKKAPDDVHTFFQHLITFGIVEKDDVDLYRKLVIGSAWRKQMPKLALSLGLADQMPDMIEELISRGQQVDAVHFTYEVGLVQRFPPVSLLKAFLKDAKKAATSILEDPNNSSRAVHLAARKEQSALKAVIKCIEEYKLEAEFPPENLKKRLEQLEKVKVEKKRPAAVGPANKRTRASNVGPMPPAKAGRITNAYVSSFPAPPTFTAPPTFVRSPLHNQYPGGVPSYSVPPPMYGGHGNRSPPTNPYAAYSPEAAPLSPPLSYPPTPPMNYPAYGGYGNGMAHAYPQAYYR
ncbi:FRIGIDA-like protein 4a [Rutidosis leptorrhynchoides]|uniref:FRIGIDA-like protein 4a n=1 Tax=Rutidosis leptorrhynchoides TaxID=125765 RepID=UPI003A99016C